MKRLSDYFQEKTFVAISHRGNGFGKENTIEALIGAINSGAHMVEFDVQVTSDHKAVLFHDDDTTRLFPGTKMKIRDTPYGTLQQKLGADAIPLLTTLWQKNTSSYYYVELKAHTNELAYKDALVQQVLEQIDFYQVSDQVLWVSFDPYMVYHRRLEGRTIMKGLNIKSPKDTEKVNLEGISCLCPNIINITPKWLEKWSEKYILPYGDVEQLVNTPELRKQLRGFTADSLQRLTEIMENN